MAGGFRPPPPVPDKAQAAGGFKPPPPVPDGAHGSSNGLAADSGHSPAAPPLGGMLQAAKGALGWGIEKLQRPNEAALALQRGPGAALQTLLHGETPEQYQTDTQRFVRFSLGYSTGQGRSLTQNEYEQLPGWYRGIGETAAQIATDPTTYLGGAGVFRRGATAVVEHGTPALVRLGDHIASHTGVGGQMARWAASRLHDFLEPGGKELAHAYRTEAIARGKQGVNNYQRLVALHGAAAAQGADFTAELSSRFLKLIKPLEAADKLRVYRAIHTGSIDKLPDNLKYVANGIQQIDRSIPYLLGSRASRKRMENGFSVDFEHPTTHQTVSASMEPFKLPDGLDRFNQRVRGVVRKNKVWINHVPQARDLDPADAERLFQRIEAGLRGRKDLASTFNPQFLRRSGDFPLNDPDLVTDSFLLSFKRAGKQLAASDLQHRMAQIFAPTKTVQARFASAPQWIAKALKDSEKAEKDPLLAPWQFAIRRAIDNANQARLHKIPMTDAEFGQLSPSVQRTMLHFAEPTHVARQMKRYADVPQHLRGAMVRPAQKLPEDPYVKENMKMIGQARNVGRAVSDTSTGLMFTTPFLHQSRIGTLLGMNAPSAIPEAIKTYAKLKGGFVSPAERAKVLGDAAQQGATGLPNIEESRVETMLHNAAQKGPAAVRTALGAIGQYYTAVQKSLWAWDDAAKKALYQVNLKRYKDPLLAAYHTQQSLVNYEMPSRLAEAMRASGLFRFTTWRTKLPPAVLKALSENPHMFAAGAHAGQSFTGNPGFAFGDNTQVGDKTRAERTPMAEAAQSVLDPRAYFRGSLGLGGHLTAYALAAALGSRYPEYWTDGQSPESFAFYELPGVSEIAPYTGHGMFKDTPLDEFLYQLGGLETKTTP